MRRIEIMQHYSDIGATIYMLAAFLATVLSSYAAPSLSKHGRSVTGISKLYFFIFYLFASFLLIWFRSSFVIHTARRLLESVLYCWNSKSKMTPLQFVHGMLYYLFLALHLRNKAINTLVLVVVVACQSVAHYRVYVMKKREFSHYFCEAVLYLYLLFYIRSWALFFNAAYVLAFVKVSIKNRKSEAPEYRMVQSVITPQSTKARL